MNNQYHTQAFLDEGVAVRDLNTWTSEDSINYLQHTLEQTSGDDKDGIFEYKFLVPTNALPDVENTDYWFNQEVREKWNIQLTIEDDWGHGQSLSLYDYADLNDGFSIKNDNLEHELPVVTVVRDKSTVDVTDESQDVTYTLEWTDESGVNLERFLDYIDPNRNGNIQEAVSYTHLTLPTKA